MSFAIILYGHKLQKCNLQIQGLIKGKSTLTKFNRTHKLPSSKPNIPVFFVHWFNLPTKGNFGAVGHIETYYVISKK